MMAAATPRKRKQSSHSPDSFSASGAPVKRIMMDFNASASQLSHQSLSLQAKLEAKSSKAEKGNRLELEAEKENLDSSLLKDLVNSPLQTASAPQTAYRLSLLNKSPKPGSPCKPAVPAESFYSKGKIYFTPLDRKLLKQNKSFRTVDEDGYIPRPSKTEKRRARKSISKNLYSKHQAGSRLARPLTKNVKRAARSMLPAKISLQNQLSNIIPKTQANGPFRVLSLKTKPKPKLLVGAAFFITGKKSHTVFKKTPEVAKPVQSASGPMAKEERQKGAAAMHTASTTNEKILEDAKDTDLPKCAKVPMKKHVEIKEAVHVERQKGGVPKEREKFRLCEVKISLQKTEKSHLIQAALLKDQTSLVSKDTKTLGSGPSLHFMTDEDEVAVPCTEATQEKRESPLETTVYPVFSTPCTNKKRYQDFQEQLASPPLGSSTPSAMASVKLGQKLNKRKAESKDQLVIDAGQKHFGAITCRSCGMIYTAASPEDEAQHVQYHRRFMEAIKFVGWKKEHIVAKFWDGKIIMIQPDGPKYAIKKAEEVRELVDNELGFKQTALSCPSKTVTYLYVSNEKKIVGCLIAEQIKQAFQVLPESVSHDFQRLEILERHQAWRCSTVPQAAICGISRVWVFSLMRRQGIASRMVDAVRATFMYGYYLSTDEIAFSDPTPDGKLFATKYCKIPNFLVYNFVG